MNDLTLVLPIAIGGRIWDIDFPERPALVMGVSNWKNDGRR